MEKTATPIEGIVMDRLKAGLDLKTTHEVNFNHTALEVGSGGIDVLATPILIGWIENAAFEMAGLCLPDAYTTVGSKVSIKHFAPTATGKTVSIHVWLTAAEGVRLTFEFEARDDDQPIAKGFHERHVVNTEDFIEKISSIDKKGITSKNDISN